MTDDIVQRLREDFEDQMRRYMNVHLSQEKSRQVLVLCGVTEAAQRLCVANEAQWPAAMENLRNHIAKLAPTRAPDGAAVTQE